jgi:hypothetical protein
MIRLIMAGAAKKAKVNPTPTSPAPAMAQQQQQQQNTQQAPTGLATIAEVDAVKRRQHTIRIYQVAALHHP